MSVVYYFERNDIFPLRGKMNKAVTMETILASGHPSDRFWERYLTVALEILYNNVAEIL